MTSTDKEILLSDLCARFPYTICVYLDDKVTQIKEIKYDSRNEVYFTLVGGSKTYIGVDIERIKPFLKSLKNMTPKEKMEYERTLNILEDGLGTKLTYTSYYAIEWLNEHHFDFRGLIEKGLAIEAPKDMYK